VLDWDRVRWSVIEENEKFVTPWMCTEELVTALKRLKNNKAPGTDSVVNEYLKYGG
jgi:hypothetical protein